MVEKYRIVFTKRAFSDIELLRAAKLLPKAKTIIDKMAEDPFFDPTAKKLVGDMAGAYSRRINIKHRIVFMVYEPERTVKIIRMWTHYEK